MDELFSKTYLDTIESIQYPENVFTRYYGNEKVLISHFCIEKPPEVHKFFDLATIYHAVIDLDKRIKYSFTQAIKYGEDISYEQWNPLTAPSENEHLSIYYSENAMYRIATLWDLLAQFYNIKENIGKDIERIHATKFFDSLKNNQAASFVCRIQAYMHEADSIDENGYPTGNYTFLKKYRNSMVHRISPSITSLSELSISLRIPMQYVLFRVICDYWQVSEFLAEIIKDTLPVYEMLNTISSNIEEQNHA